jgi:hypothetical protein
MARQAGCRRHPVRFRQQYPAIFEGEQGGCSAIADIGKNGESHRVVPHKTGLTATDSFANYPKHCRYATQHQTSIQYDKPSISPFFSRETRFADLARTTIRAHTLCLAAITPEGRIAAHFTTAIAPFTWNATRTGITASASSAAGHVDCDGPEPLSIR